MKSIRVFIVFSLLLAISLAGCDRQSQQQDGSKVEMSLVTVPDPPAVGAATLVITLVDEEGTPVEDARLAVKGDMSHAGMQPVLANADGGPGGVYEVPFNWTMGGDWFVTVEATLDDGSTLSRRFDLIVAGEMDMEMGE